LDCLTISSVIAEGLKEAHRGALRLKGSALALIPVPCILPIFNAL
jgi:hypothetical protein